MLWAGPTIGDQLKGYRHQHSHTINEIHSPARVVRTRLRSSGTATINCLAPVHVLRRELNIKQICHETKEDTLCSREGDEMEWQIQYLRLQTVFDEAGNFDSFGNGNSHHCRVHSSINTAPAHEKCHLMDFSATSESINGKQEEIDIDACSSMLTTSNL
ncbi:hypothetical protein B0H12DRAFT_1077299 [Mycena haematopus]|nr:hypothetical protein B0H12DRAFT_1077299 [Mycena haematopus]